jgi:hypothetical protein
METLDLADVQLKRTSVGRHRAIASISSVECQVPQILDRWRRRKLVDLGTFGPFSTRQCFDLGDEPSGLTFSEAATIVASSWPSPGEFSGRHHDRRVDVYRQLRTELSAVESRMGLWAAIAPMRPANGSSERRERSRAEPRASFLWCSKLARCKPIVDPQRKSRFEAD